MFVYLGFEYNQRTKKLAEKVGNQILVVERILPDLIHLHKINFNAKFRLDLTHLTTLKGAWGSLYTIAGRDSYGEGVKAWKFAWEIRGLDQKFIQNATYSQSTHQRRENKNFTVCLPI